MRPSLCLPCQENRQGRDHSSKITALEGTKDTFIAKWKRLWERTRRGIPTNHWPWWNERPFEGSRPHRHYWLVPMTKWPPRTLPNLYFILPTFDGGYAVTVTTGPDGSQSQHLRAAVYSRGDGKSVVQMYVRHIIINASLVSLQINLLSFSYIVGLVYFPVTVLSRTGHNQDLSWWKSLKAVPKGLKGCTIHKGVRAIAPQT